MIRYFTGGESHGKGLIAIIDGFPAGLFVDVNEINSQLSKRQSGYGRGKRMLIEGDRIILLSGVRGGYTLGSPISLYIENKDFINWQDIMDPDIASEKKLVSLPRPGHADLSGGIKYNHHDLRNVLERASARETAIRTSVGSLSKLLLKELNIELYSFVVSIGDINIDQDILPQKSLGSKYLKKLNRLIAADQHMLWMPDTKASLNAVKKIEGAKKNGDTLGGVFEIRATNVPPGIGSYVQWDRKLDARIAMALMSVQAIKAVEVGDGFKNAFKYGSDVHDEIFYKGNYGFFRKTDRAGGIEGGVTNGEELIVRAYMKPISTLYKPLKSVDVVTKEPGNAAVERSDICAVPAASVVGEAVIAIELANAIMEKFGGDSIIELKRNYKSYLSYMEKY
ncbi:MAG: chorismate synthase [Deltaproteobacteria bacterium]|nr:chorismate synthase [Deltaproteobacteria bacterium]MCL5792816.1 chorismate synthase [Deltaproteobacteria bacterium]